LRHFLGLKDHIFCLPSQHLPQNRSNDAGARSNRKHSIKLKTIAEEVLLSYLSFSKMLQFQLYTDVSHCQLRAIITQDGKRKPIVYWSCTLNPAQTQYTTTEHELLSIVEVLKEFKIILWGHHIQVFTDHHNLMYKQFNTKCIMHWWLFCWRVKNQN
jgi:hypothetical protein